MYATRSVWQGSQEAGLGQVRGRSTPTSFCPASAVPGLDWTPSPASLQHRSPWQGGLKVSPDSVVTILTRSHNNDGPIIRIQKGVWGLAAWYPKRPAKIGRSTKEVIDEGMTEGKPVDEIIEDEVEASRDRRETTDDDTPGFTRVRRVRTNDELYSDQTFENVMLKLDDSAFSRCRLVGCHLLYGGGEVVMVETQAERCQVQFYGPAARTVAILPSLGWSYSPPHERLG
jgi:hypothetical protein